MYVCACSVSHVRLFATPWAVVHQAPLSMGFFQVIVLEWVCHFFLCGIFLIQGSNPRPLHLLHWQADSLPLNHLESQSQAQLSDCSAHTPGKPWSFLNPSSMESWSTHSSYGHCQGRSIPGPFHGQQEQDIAMAENKMHRHISDSLQTYSEILASLLSLQLDMTCFHANQSINRFLLSIHFHITTSMNHSSGSN